MSERPRHILHVTVDIEELAVRLMEARMDRDRPCDYSAAEIMDALPEEHREWMLRQAQAAADYIVKECLRAAHPIPVQ